MSSLTNTDFTKILESVHDVFDERLALATEAMLSTMAILLLDEVKRCPGLAIVGPSGAGKTTVLDFVKDAEYENRQLTYWSDDITPAAFVSHDPSSSEAELQQIDLLNKIQHKTLINADMAGWFSGGENQIRAMMAKMARVMDGEGLHRNSGVHGERGYEGDYRFGILGATTPLDKRAWSVMGHVGNRLLFYELPRIEDHDKVVEDVIEGKEHGVKIEECRSEINEFLNALWAEYDGYGGKTWTSNAQGDVRKALAYLARLIEFCRRPMDGPRESPHRVMSSLWDTARGHALLCGRDKLELQDLAVCSRLALSTMHKERRGIVRAVIDPDYSNPITTSELTAHPATRASRKTLRKRMELLEELELGKCIIANSGRETRKFELKQQFIWPEYLPLPDFK